MTRKKLYQPIEKRLHLKPVHLKNVTSIMILPCIQILILPSKTTISPRASLNSS